MSLIDIQVAGKWDEIYAGVWLPLTLIITRPMDEAEPIRLRNIVSSEKGIQLDIDLFQRDVELKPGEKYQCVILIMAIRRTTIDMSRFYVEIDGASVRLKELVSFPPRILSVRPAILGELKIEVEPICDYRKIRKMEVSLNHIGTTPFKNLSITAEPSGAIHSGKLPFVRQEFLPSAKEILTVAASQPFTLVLKAEVDGLQVTASKPIAIDPLAAERHLKFVFLDPSRLAKDRIIIQTLDKKVVPSDDSAYRVRSGNLYTMILHPEQSEIQKPEITAMPRSVQAQNIRYDDKLKAWLFDLDVAHPDLLSQPQILRYRAETPNGPYAGEVHLRVMPQRWRYLRFAITGGLALTIKGGIELYQSVFHDERDVIELIGESTFDLSLMSILSLASIPILWAGVAIYDHVMYRFRH